LANRDQAGSRKGRPEHKVLVSGSIQVNRPPEIERRHNSERKDDDATHKAEREEDAGRERKKMWLEGLTLAAVLGYAFIAAWQGFLTRESIDNNSKQFQIDQRPYIWTTNKTPYLHAEAGQKMWANIEAVNFGKSPALKTRFIGKLFFGPSAGSDADKWFDLIGGRPIDDPNHTEIVVPPGIASVFPRQSEIAQKPENEKPKLNLEEIPAGGFGGGGFFTVLSDNVLKQSDVDYILGNDESMRIVVRIQYFDAYGNRYWTNVCLSRFTNGTTPSCPHHNEMY
jgi:hypothetical protein